ncbi:hypothetical protein BC937DRAFT_94272 [Endogone sp. FLAS-F59071]|nr:hypothetical protein BC937DRAFT_94272 [Endogone sp. FLAS-F59071]|eukprot:RUS14144.1 hypothetical protein BC937DRAFT_94272 [Endogone sp. FLAS-F59071]
MAISYIGLFIYREEGKSGERSYCAVHG